MKSIQYLFFIILITLFHTAVAQVSNNGTTIISQEEHYNVPMPNWMKETNSNTAHVETFSENTISKESSVNNHVFINIENIQETTIN